MDRAGRNTTKLYAAERMASVSAPLSRNTAPNQSGKLAALKSVHEGRLQSQAELREALLDVHSGDVALAFKHADALLSRVRAPELDLTGLTREEAHWLQRTPPEAWASLQRYALLSNDTGITSVALSSTVNIDDGLVDGLAQLHVQHLAIGRRVTDTLMARLQKLPCLEHLTQREPAREPVQFAAALQQSGPRGSVTSSLRGANRPPASVRKKQSGRAAVPMPTAQDTSLQLGLNAAMKSGDSRKAKYFASEILKAPLGPVLRLQLLSDSFPDSATPVPQPRKTFVPALSAFVDDVDDVDDGESKHQPRQPSAPRIGVPLLGRLCSELAATARQNLPHEQGAAIEAYLDEILNSDLSTQDKITLCTSTVATPQGTRTAARLAIQNGQPDVVATMMRSILESSVEPEEKLELLAALDVSREEVDNALSMPHLQKLPWVKYLNDMLKVGWDGLALMTDGRVVTLKDMPGTERDVLAVHQMWTKGSGAVLCSAGREISQLRFHRIPQHEREQYEEEGRYCYAIPPDWLVKQPAGTPIA